MSRPQGGQDHDRRGEKEGQAKRKFSNAKGAVKAVKHEKLKEHRFRIIKLNRLHLQRSQ